MFTTNEESHLKNALREVWYAVKDILGRDEADRLTADLYDFCITREYEVRNKPVENFAGFRIAIEEDYDNGR